MLKARVIPCLLLQQQGLVKTIRFRSPRYVGDPINAVRIFNEKEVDELIFLDIGATVGGSPPPVELLERIASEAFMPFCYGGGIRTMDQVRMLLGLGIEKLALNTVAAERPEFVTQVAEAVGSQSVVAALDVKKNWLGKYTVWYRSARTNTGEDPVAAAVRMQALGAGELLVTSVDREGTASGYDLDLARRVCAAVDIPVIINGGAGSLTDVRRAVTEAHVSAAAAGTMFVFHGKHRAVLISYPSQSELAKALT